MEAILPNNKLPIQAGFQSLCVLGSGLVITMVVSLLFILLLRYTADVLLWLLIFGVIAAIGYGESATPTFDSAPIVDQSVIFLPTWSCRHLALLLGVQSSDRQAGRQRHHLRHRLPHRLQLVPAAQPDVAHLPYVCPSRALRQHCVIQH